MAIRCGHCGERHTSVADVRACAKIPQRTQRSKQDQAEAFGRAQIAPYDAARKAGEAVQRRANPTKGEASLAQALTRAGIVFVREHQIDGFVVDFYIGSAKTIIEVDGSIHRFSREADKLRDDHFRANHYTVIRTSTTEAVERPTAVLDQLNLKAIRAKQPSPRRNTTASTKQEASARQKAAKATKKNLPKATAPPKQVPVPKQVPRPQSNPSVRRKFHCESCNRSFVDLTNPWPTCRRCSSKPKVECRNQACSNLLPIGQHSGECPPCALRTADIRASRFGGLQTYWDSGKVRRIG
jgi:very-short-patch-repair endonuclease